MNPFSYIVAIFALIRLGLLTRFALSGPYWSWRLHTAYGDPSTKTKAVPQSQRITHILTYARWTSHMARLSRFHS